MKKYKYLVTNGDSQTWGENCRIDKTWPVKLAERLGLELINLATPGSGWIKLRTSTNSFILNNKDILDECFFILQKSTLQRLFDSEHLPVYRTDVWEKYNMKYLQLHDFCVMGVDDYEKFGYPPSDTSRDEHQNCTFLYDRGVVWKEEQKWSRLLQFPEHKHYPNSRHKWRLGDENTYPPYIDEQFEELMAYWAMEISSFHTFLKHMNIDHIMVDGYSPFLSYKLDFTHYYDTDEEFEYVKKFWSTETNNPLEEKVYDFKNIRAGYLFDSIDSKYKIDDVVLWSLYQFKDHRTEWNVDGGHAGPKGMELICDVIEKNIKEKGWF
jgi:hypothetical protein